MPPPPPPSIQGCCSKNKNCSISRQTETGPNPKKCKTWHYETDKTVSRLDFVATPYLAEEEEEEEKEEEEEEEEEEEDVNVRVFKEHRQQPEGDVLA